MSSAFSLRKLHIARGIHGWTHGQRSYLRTLEDLCPTSRQMVSTILCCLWLYQGSHEHSHNLCHTLMHVRLLSPHQPNQHPPPSVGGQSRTWPISTVTPPSSDNIQSSPKNECTLEPPSTSEQTAHTLHNNAGF
jgi:hypothetical protein